MWAALQAQVFERNGPRGCGLGAFIVCKNVVDDGIRIGVVAGIAAQPHVVQHEGNQLSCFPQRGVRLQQAVRIDVWLCRMQRKMVEAAHREPPQLLHAF